MNQTIDIKQADPPRATFAARYTFSGKEKDTETGYNYFGARYYNSNLSVWLSVDPMSDKYPTMSGYVYCANNPVMLVDPDGRYAWKPDGKGGWVAEAGDSPGSLARDAHISQAAAEAAVKSANHARGQTRTSETMVYKGDVVTLPLQQTATITVSSKGNSKNNSQEQTSPAHSITIGGVFSGGIGLSLDFGHIWDKDGGGFLFCFGFCTGVDMSCGLNYSNYKNIKAAEAFGDMIVGSVGYGDAGYMPKVGYSVGVSYSPLPAGLTMRKTYSIILRPDFEGYGDYISKFGHPHR